MDQWNTIEKPEVDPYKYAQMIFDKYVKPIQRRQTSKNGAEAIRYLQAKTNEKKNSFATKKKTQKGS